MNEIGSPIKTSESPDFKLFFPKRMDRWHGDSGAGAEGDEENQRSKQRMSGIQTGDRVFE